MLVKMCKKRFNYIVGHRYDRDSAIYYFSEKDFENLNCEKFVFEGDRKVKLSGAFYYYGKINTQRIIFFEHGIAVGHHSYFKEIEILCSHGYTVFSYDHTGCDQSEGETIVGFSQSLNDLDHAINAVKKDERFKDAKISVVGHSWGGFSSLNIGAIHPEITHIVAISGFISPRQLIDSYVPKILKKCRKALFDEEVKSNEYYSSFDARESLKKTNAKVMIIHSENDKLVNYKMHFIKLFEELKTRKDTLFITIAERGHNPQYSKRGVYYLMNLNRDYKKLLKKKSVTEKDRENFKNIHRWNKITDQDKSVWRGIFKFLDSPFNEN